LPTSEAACWSRSDGRAGVWYSAAAEMVQKDTTPWGVERRSRKLPPGAGARTVGDLGVALPSQGSNAWMDKV
jgi:hypothetical protein